VAAHLDVGASWSIMEQVSKLLSRQTHLSSKRWQKDRQHLSQLEQMGYGVQQLSQLDQMGYGILANDMSTDL
jgi:hypothetical protein